MDDLKIGYYQHYKGGFYYVLGISYHSETVEKLVTYIMFSEDSQGRTNGMWVRPYDMFLGEVEIEGKKVPRFKYVGESLKIKD